MKKSFLLLLSLILLSCSSFNPYDYKETIEDAIRFEAICILLERNIATLNVRNSTYERLLDEAIELVHQAKTIHKYPTYYMAFQMLKLNINDYISETRKAQQYTTIIEQLIIKYNQQKADLDGWRFTKVANNEYVTYFKIGEQDIECRVKKTKEGVTIDINRL